MLVAAPALLVGLYALLLWLPGSFPSGVTKAETITVFEGRDSLDLVAGGGAFLAACWALWLVFRRRRRGAGCLLFLLSLACPVFLVLGALIHGDSFTDLGSVQGPDGAEYHLLGWDFLQGSRIAIGRLSSRVGPVEKYRMLAFSFQYGDAGYLAVVRPQAPSGDRTLYLTSNSLLLGAPYENVAYVAYDLKTRKAYGQLVGIEQGRADIREISPFVLLGRADVPREPDVQSLFDAAGWGRPFPRAVKPDLGNPNPKVADLARRLLDYLKRHPPQS